MTLPARVKVFAIDDTTVEITDLKSGERGSGQGRATMSAIIELADELGVALELWPLYDENVEDGLGQSELEQWYRRLGFKFIPNRDPDSDGEMDRYWVRTPSGGLVESQSRPTFLYHATYEPYLDSIQQHGLGGVQGKCNYDCSRPGITYLASTPQIAYSYAEVSEEVPESYLDQIVVLAIPVASLNPSLLKDDTNVSADEPEYAQTFEYHGPIPHFRII